MELIEADIATGGLEGTKPSVDNCTIFEHYKINTKGEITGKTGKILQYRFKTKNKNPFVAITVKTKNKEGNFEFKKKELPITSLMELKFEYYITGYSKARNSTEEYMIVPIDGKRNNLSLSNLHYVEKKEYNLNGTAEGCLTKLPSLIKEKTNEELAKMFKISPGRVARIRKKMKLKGDFGIEELNKLTISFDLYPVYKALFLSKGLKSNLELAKKLRPEANFKDNKIKRQLSDKFVRARKILIREGLIEEYNTYQKDVKMSEIKENLRTILEENKKLPRQDRVEHTEIAKTLGMSKNQIDYASRGLNKQKKLK